MSYEKFYVKYPLTAANKETLERFGDSDYVKDLNHSQRIRYDILRNNAKKLAENYLLYSPRNEQLAQGVMFLEATLVWVCLSMLREGKNELGNAELFNFREIG